MVFQLCLGGLSIGETLLARSLLQGIVTPATIVTACSAALAPLYNWLLVDVFNVGLAGAALANDAVQVMACGTPCTTSLLGAQAFTWHDRYAFAPVTAAHGGK